MLSILSMAGESISRAFAQAVQSGDGSFIGVQTNQGAYTAGETIHGYVVAQINSPRQVDRVLVVVTCKERTMWDEEYARTITEGEGEKQTTRTVYEHYVRSSRYSYMKELIVASQLPHILNAGSYSYPFAYSLAPHLPGCTKFVKEVDAMDPAWRNSGRRLRVCGEVTYKIKAFLDVAGIFSRDLRSKQEVTVNSAFDWSAMRPQVGERTGTVLLMCCIPRGSVTLKAAFDRAAYAAGETAHIKAEINNQSEQDVKQMVVKLMRFITLRDQAGHSKSLVDTVCTARYPGVGMKSSAMRDLPLPLFSGSNSLLPGTKARTVEISYRFDVECDLTCAPDIEVHLPMVVFAPKPATWGLSAMGLAVPQGIAFNFPVAPMLQQPLALPAPPMVAMPPMQQQQVAYAPQQQQVAYAPQQQQQVAYPPQQQQPYQQAPMQQQVSFHQPQMQAQASFHQPQMQAQVSFHQQPQMQVSYQQQPQMQAQASFHQQQQYPPQQTYPPQQQQYPPQMAVSMGGSMGSMMPAMPQGGDGFAMSGQVTTSSSSSRTENGQLMSASASSETRAF